MKTTAVAIGDNCVDCYLPPIGLEFSGGNAANVAVYLQRTGCPAAYLGIIGGDEKGQKLLRDLTREGVDTSRVKVSPQRATAYTHIRLTQAKERQFVFEDLGPIDELVMDEADLAFIRGHRLVHNTWQGNTDRDLARFKEAGGPLVSLDYGERYTPDFVERTIRHVDIAFFSLPEDSLRTLADLAQEMKARGPALVVVTQGTLGSLALGRDALFQPAFPVATIDTLGAGDAYIGTFLAKWLSGKAVLSCMKAAAWTASQACRHYGGW